VSVTERWTDRKAPIFYSLEGVQTVFKRFERDELPLPDSVASAEVYVGLRTPATVVLFAPEAVVFNRGADGVSRRNKGRQFEAVRQ
jgi:hypothetical protein